MQKLERLWGVSNAHSRLSLMSMLSFESQTADSMDVLCGEKVLPLSTDKAVATRKMLVVCWGETGWELQAELPRVCVYCIHGAADGTQDLTFTRHAVCQ